MGFRRNGKAMHADAREWGQWLAQHSALLSASSLPAHVLVSRADWEYLLAYGYHGYPRIDFLLEDLSPDQRIAFRQLLEAVISPEERDAGSSCWNFDCPPESPSEGHI